MGATSWHYFTPYTPDPEEALQRLRAEIFARGDYVDLTGSMEDMLRSTYQRFGEDPGSPAVQTQIEHSLRLQRATETGDTTGLDSEERSFVRRVRWFTWFARLLGADEGPPHRSGKPQTIDELLEWAAESGTHSILDIEHVGRRREFGVAAPLKKKDLEEFLETTEPTHAQVEEYWDDIAELLDRWEAHYLVVYRDGRPDEYAFIGCSGD